MTDENINPQDEEIVDLGDEAEVSNQKPEKKIYTFEPKTDLNPYDIFKLAKGILIVAAGIYVLIALIRIFYTDSGTENSGIKEVWEYSKVVLNSIVSLVLGLYFGSKQESKRSR